MMDSGVPSSSSIGLVIIGPIIIITIDAIRDSERHVPTAVVSLSLSFAPNTYKQGKQQVEDWAGTTNSSQRIVTNIVANDYRVSCIIKLLSNVTDKHWNSKFHQSF